MMWLDWLQINHIETSATMWFMQWRNIGKINTKYRNKAKRCRGSYLSFSGKNSQEERKRRRNRRLFQSLLKQYCKPSSRAHHKPNLLNRHSLPQYNSLRANGHPLHHSYTPFRYTYIILGTQQMGIGRIRIRGPKVSIKIIYNKDTKDSLETINKDPKDNAEVL